MRQLRVIRDKQAFSAAEVAREEYLICGPSPGMFLLILCLSLMTKSEALKYPMVLCLLRDLLTARFWTRLLLREQMPYILKSMGNEALLRFSLLHFIYRSSVRGQSIITSHRPWKIRWFKANRILSFVITSQLQFHHSTLRFTNACYDSFFLKRFLKQNNKELIISWEIFRETSLRQFNKHKQPTVKPHPEAHMDMILFEVFLKSIDLIP